MIPVAVHMTPMRFPPTHGCAVVAKTRVGSLLGCASNGFEHLRLRRPDGTLVRFGTLNEPIGVYESAAVSPNGKWLLLQADLPCDTRGAFVVRTSGGTPRFVPRIAQGCEGSLGHAVGWTANDKAVVRVSGRVYAVEPR